MHVIQDHESTPERVNHDESEQSQECQSQAQIIISAAAPKKKAKKGSYSCARCGLPKKGHVCAASHLPPGKRCRKRSRKLKGGDSEPAAARDKDEEQDEEDVEEEAPEQNAAKKADYLCAQCGQVKKDHRCTPPAKCPSIFLSIPTVRARRREQGQEQKGAAKANMVDEEAENAGNTSRMALPPAPSSLVTKASSKAYKAATHYNQHLAAYAARNTAPFSPSLFSGAPPFRRGAEEASAGGEGEGGGGVVRLHDWWASRLGPRRPFPPALRVEESLAGGGGDAWGTSPGAAVVVVPPYQSAASHHSHPADTSVLRSVSPSSLYMNAAGPVWDVAFAPRWAGSGAAGTSKDARGANGCVQRVRHLAVATSRMGWLCVEEGRAAGTFRHGVGNDCPRTLEPEREAVAAEQEEANLLQVWQVLEGQGEGEGRGADEHDDGPALAVALAYMVHIESEPSAIGEQGGGRCREVGAHWKVSTVDSFIHASSPICFNCSSECILCFYLRD
jgi:hypothetical protein